MVDPSILQNSSVYIPYIFMEWDKESEVCGDLGTRLLNIGYKPWFGFSILVSHIAINKTIFRISNIVDYTYQLSAACLQCKSGNSYENLPLRWIPVVWVHSQEKIIWPHKEEHCICGKVEGHLEFSI